MLGERIRTCRKKMRISQIKLAEHLNVSQAAITAWEREQRKPDVDMILKMADFFDVSTDYLLGRDLLSEQEPDRTPQEKHTHADALTPEMKTEVEEIVRKTLRKYFSHKR